MMYLCVLNIVSHNIIASEPGLQQEEMAYTAGVAILGVDAVAPYSRP